MYLPPQSSQESYQLHCDVTEHMVSEYNDSLIITIGDYNLPEITSNDHLSLSTSGHNPAAECLIVSFSFLNLFQHNNIANTNNVILDLVFSTSPKVIITCANNALVKCDRHHPALSINVLCDMPGQRLDYEEFVYNFKNCDFNAISNYLLNLDWDNTLHTNIENAVDLFYVFLYQRIDIFVPKMKLKSNFKFPVWFDANLIKNIKAKRTAHRQYKISKSQATTFLVN